MTPPAVSIGDWARGGASPRIPDSVLASRDDEVPAQHTAAELAIMLKLLRAARATDISIGHGRHPASIAAAQALTHEWENSGGTVLTVTDWPRNAASWLRPAQRLTRHGPDAWVIADTPAGTAQLSRRLAQQNTWSSARTFGFASADGVNLAGLAGPGILEGLTGPTETGLTWRLEVDGIRLIASPPARVR